ISPSVTSIYDYRLALHLESPSPSQPEHRLARCCTPYHPPSPNVHSYELYNAQALSSRLNDNLTSSNTTSRPLAGPTQAPGQAGRLRSHPYQSAPSINSSPRSIPSVFSSNSSRRTQPYPGCRVTIPTRATTLQHVPSPIGSPVSPLNQSYQFKPFVEDDDDETTSGSDKRISVFPTHNPSTFSRGTTSSPSAPRTKRTRPHPRLSIFLTPPLQATGSPGASSPPPTPILAVLEEGYHDCLRAVLKQDALVAAVNHTKHLRIASDRLYCSESQPRSQGAYGDVWLGRLDDGSGNPRVVAVKRIRLKPQDGPSNAGLLK
ncbi:hypothetical protein FRC05_008686, partial [Tulasnella sp. 425]